MAQPKITDVARRAGVGIATVSRVLNNSGYVAAATKQKVLKAIAFYNYQPNAVAKSLVQKSTKLIGVVISDILNPFYAQIVRAIEDTCDHYQYSVVLCNTDESVEKEKKYLKILLGKQVDGIIMAGGRGIGDKYNRYLFETAREVPLVLANEFIEHENIYCVYCDKEKGAYDMTNHLIGLGHRDIVHIAGYPDYKPTHDRINGFTRAMTESGISLSEGSVVYSNYHSQGGYETTLQLLQRKEVPTAIFASNDLMAIGTIKALQEKNISVPQQIAVVGSDDIAFNELLTPGLTTISHNVYDLGLHSVSTLIKLMQGGEAQKKIIIDTRLIVRQSCGGGK